MSGESKGRIFARCAYNIAAFPVKMAVALATCDADGAQALAESAAQAVRKRVNRKYEKTEFGIFAEIAKISILAYRESKRADELAEELRNRRGAELKRIGEKLTASGDRGAYLSDLEQAGGGLTALIAAKTNEFGNTSAEKLIAEADNFKYKMNLERDKLLETVGSEAALKDRAETTAKAVIKSAEALLEQIIGNYKNNESAALKKQLELAKQQRLDGNYEAAVITAFGAVNEAAAFAARAEARLLLPRILLSLNRAALAEAESFLLSVRDVAFKNNSEIYDIDLAEFMEGDYERGMSAIETMKKSLSREAGEYTAEELQDLRGRINTLFVNANKDAAKGFERVGNAFLRDEVCELVKSALEGCGLREEELPAAETPGVADGSARLFVHPQTGEEIRVYLTPDFDENGILQTGLELLSEAEDNETAACEQRRARYRERILSTLNDSAVMRESGVETELDCAETTKHKNVRRAGI